VLRTANISATGRRRTPHRSSPSVTSRRQWSRLVSGPVCANQVQQTLRGTVLRRKTGPAVDHFYTPLLLDAPFPLQTKHLSHLAPVATEVVIEIRAGHHLAAFQATMPFLDLDVRLPGPPIRLLICKKEFQVRLRGWCIAFDDHDHIAARTLHQATELVIALGGIGGENAPFAPDFRQQGLECTHFIVVLSNWALLQDDASLHFIDMQHLLLCILSSRGLRSRSSSRFAINGQVHMSFIGLCG
jgi:hypothetical protein